jgi:hypothetical protein
MAGNLWTNIKVNQSLEQKFGRKFNVCCHFDFVSSWTVGAVGTFSFQQREKNAMHTIL